MKTFTYVIGDDAGNSVTAIQEAPDALSILPKWTGDEALLDRVPMEFKQAIPCDFFGERLKAWLSSEVGLSLFTSSVKGEFDQQDDVHGSFVAATKRTVPTNGN